MSASSCGFRRSRSQRSELMRVRSEEHTSELQSLAYLVCRLLLEKKKYGRFIACEHGELLHAVQVDGINGVEAGVLHPELAALLDAAEVVAQQEVAQVDPHGLPIKLRGFFF